MASKSDSSGLIKEVCYVFITLLAYILLAVNRSCLAFLFHQLENPNSSIKVDEEQKSWIASFTMVLSPIGCLISGVIMDVFGRRLYIQAVFLPFAFSWLVISVASNVQMLYIGMAIQSFGGGMSFCIPAYISEISSKNRRGALLSTIEITFNVGVLLNNLLMYNFSWKSVAKILTTLSSAGFMLSFVLPESPMWLYSKGFKRKSIKTLESLRCSDQSSLEYEIQDMENACQSKPKINFANTIRGCFKAWKQFVIVMTLFVLMQNTGCSVLLAFTITIIDRLKLPFESPKIAILYSAAGFIASIITPYTMHNFGRKTLLTASALGLVISMTCIAIYEELFYFNEEKPLVWIIPVALCLHAFTSTLGILPISFVIGGELFPHEVRGVMNGIFGAIGFTYWTIIFKFFPQFLLQFGIKVVLWTFSGFAVLSVLYGIFLLPETKGISLNEVQQKYFHKKSKNGDFEMNQSADQMPEYREGLMTNN